MCQKCADAMVKYFPDADDKTVDFILWNKTAFPMGSAEQVVRQIKEYAEAQKALANEST